MDLEGELDVHYIESKIENKFFFIFFIMQQIIPQGICSPTVTESASVAEFILGTLRRWQSGVRRVAAMQRLDGP